MPAGGTGLTFTVHIIGISNGKSSFQNGGCDFGPDTPGTVTMGIDEALDYARSVGAESVFVVKKVDAYGAVEEWGRLDVKQRGVFNG